MILCEKFLIFKIKIKNILFVTFKTFQIEL